MWEFFPHSVREKEAQHFLKCPPPSLTAIAFQVCERNTGKKLHRQDLRFHPSSLTQITSQSQCIYVSLQPFFIPFPNPALLEEASGNVLQSTYTKQLHFGRFFWAVRLLLSVQFILRVCKAPGGCSDAPEIIKLQHCNVPCLLFLQSWITDRHKQPNLGWPFVVFWFEKVQGTLKVSVKCTRCSIIKAAAQVHSDAGSVWMFPRCQVPSIAGMEVESIGDLKRNQKES